MGTDSEGDKGSRSDRWVAWGLYALCALLLLLKAPSVIQGYFLFPGWLGVLPLGAIGAVIIFGTGVVWLILRGKFRFWNRLTFACLLAVLWALPIMDGWVPRLAGYWLRVRIQGDIPAILEWVDGRPTAEADADAEDHDWERVPPGELPACAEALGVWAEYSPSRKAVRIRNGSGLTGAWGVTVGRGIGDAPGGWKVNDDAYVWDLP